MARISIYNHGNIGVIAAVVYPIVAAFIENGYKVRLLAGGDEESLRKSFSYQTNKLEILPTRAGLLAHLVQLTRFLAETDKEPIIVLTETQAILVKILKTLLRVNANLVLKKRGALGEERYYLSGSKFVRWAYWQIEKLALRSCDRAIFVSYKMREYFERDFGFKKPNIVVNNKVIPAGRKPLTTKETNIENVEIVYSGSASKWQRTDYILSLFERLSHLHGLSFRIISYWDIDHSEYQITNLRIERHSPQEIVYELSKSDIGIIVRDQNILNRVSSPLKIGEYVSAGLNVILTNDIGDYSELIKNNNLGCIITGRNLAEDTQIIRRFLEEFRNAAPERRSRARKLAERRFLDYSDYLEIFS